MLGPERLGQAFAELFVGGRDQAGLFLPHRRVDGQQQEQLNGKEEPFIRFSPTDSQNLTEMKMMDPVLIFQTIVEAPGKELKITWTNIFY